MGSPPGQSARDGAAGGAAPGCLLDDVPVLRVRRVGAAGRRRDPDEVFELVIAALRRLKLPIIHQQPPDDSVERPGFIEVADRTLILGLHEDIAIRVSGTEKHARVDVRSAWRYGKHDLGFNAARVRVLLKEIVVAMESSVPAGREEKAEEPKEDEPRNRRSKNRSSASTVATSTACFTRTRVSGCRTIRS